MIRQEKEHKNWKWKKGISIEHSLIHRVIVNIHRINKRIKVTKNSVHENQFYFNKSEAKSLKIKILKIALKLKMTKQCDGKVYQFCHHISKYYILEEVKEEWINRGI